MDTELKMPENLYCKGQLTLSPEGLKNWDKIVWDYMKDPDEWHLPKDAKNEDFIWQPVIFGGKGT